MEPFETIFLEARAIDDPAERAAYLAKVCGNDAALIAKVKGMLRDAREADEFFGRERIGNFGDKLLEGPGTTIGRYKLLQKIGEGGMGVVYMAEQREPVMRKVALKIIKLGMDTPQVIARFETERQALALMDHSNIAKVLDGGATDTGRPYFVMELVQGLPITQFCDERHLPPSERIKLFLEVCSAVQHAHQKGIIHRDLKPSNILVTMHGDRPVPKVIDFGVAKATQGRLTDKTVFTQFQQFVGTPAYMSPEQTSLSGLDVDTRSDIYALGVLLYELLTGKTPFDAKELVKAGLDQMRQIIREQEPPKPSTRLSTMQGEDLNATAKHRHTEAPKLIHIVRGDLDWIVMKCLEKDRTRRYETASGLAMDLQRHLGNEPVQARPPSSFYRIQKAVRRHRIAFSAAGAVTLSLILGIAASLWQAARATRAEHDAREQAEKARAITDFVINKLLLPANPTEDPVFDPNKRGLLERIALALDNELTNHVVSGIASQFTSLTNHPVIEADIRSALGQGFGWFRDYDRALAQYERVLELRERHLGPDHSDTLHTAARVAYAYLRLNRIPEAEKLIDSTIALGKRSPAGPSGGLGVALMVKGCLLQRQGRATEALPCLQEAISIMTKALGERYSDIGASLAMIAQVTESLGHIEEARVKWDEIVRHNTNLYGLNHPGTVGALMGQAAFLLRHEQTNEGLSILESTLPIHLQVFGSNSLDFLSANFQVAKAYEQTGRIEKTGQLFADLPAPLSKFIAVEETLDNCGYIATFFARHHQYSKAKAAFEPLRDALNGTKLSRPLELTWLLRTTAGAQSWPAVAETCRSHFDAFPDQPGVWRVKASVFAYAGDTEWYRKAASKAIALSDSATTWNEQIAIIQTAARGPMEFSTEETERCKSLISQLESALARATTNQLQQGHRATGALLLRLGQPDEALAALEKSLLYRPAQIDRTATFYLETICLARLNRPTEAKAAFQKAESLQKKLFMDPLGDSENFLSEAECNCLLLRREAQASISGI